MNDDPRWPRPAHITDEQADWLRQGAPSVNGTPVLLEPAKLSPNGLGSGVQKRRKPVFRRLRAFLAFQLATLLIFGWCRRKPIAWWADLAARNDRAARAFSPGPLPAPLEAQRSRFLAAASDARLIASAIRVEAEENLAVLE